MMARSQARSMLALVVASAFTFAVGTSCFSEHPSPTASTNVLGACQISDVTTLAGATQAIVVIHDFAFHPDTLVVHPGTTVTWVNCDAHADAHTTTADGGQWDSPLIQAGSTYQRAFATAGTFSYHCTPHPFMKATVIVQ